MSIFTLQEAFKSFDMVKEAEPVIRASTDKAIELNVGQQRRGKDAFNVTLPRYRSLKYARAKHDRNPLAPFGIWDLWLTGSFQAMFKAAVTNGQLYMFSADSKYDKILARVPNAMGLTEDSKVTYNNEAIVPGLIQVFKQRTGL